MPGHCGLPCADCVNLSAMPFLEGPKQAVDGRASEETALASNPDFEPRPRQWLDDNPLIGCLIFRIGRPRFIFGEPGRSIQATRQIPMDVA